MASTEAEMVTDAVSAEAATDVGTALYDDNDETPRPAPAKRRRPNDDAEPDGLDKPLPEPMKRIDVDRRDYDDQMSVGHKRNRFRSPGGDRRSFGRGRGGFKGTTPRRMSAASQREMAEQQLMHLLAQVGDQLGNECEDYLFHTADIIEVDLRAHSDFIVRTVVDCAMNLPLKTSFYATLVGLLNMKDATFGGQVVSLLESKLESLRMSCRVVDFSLLMVFAAELTNWRVIDVTDFMNNVKSLLDLALAPDSPQGKADYAAYIAMTCIARCGKYFYRSAGVETAMSLLKNYFSNRSDTEVPHFECISGRLKESRPLLKEMYAAFLALAEDEFSIRVIRAPNRQIRDRVERVERHQFNFQLRIEDSIGSRFRLPMILSLLPKCVVPSRLTRMDEIIMREQLFRTAYCFHEDPKEAARLILEVATHFQSEHILVEMCFSRMIDITHSSRHPSYWNTLLVWLLKKDSTVMAPLIGRAANSLFRNLVHMDIESRDRFTRWFGFHLSNFSFQWPWPTWSFAAELPDGHPQKVFLQETVSMAVRLSYWDRVQEAVNEAPAVEKLLPERPEPNFKFGENSGASDELKKSYVVLRDAIRRRDGISALVADLDEELRVPMVMQGILDVGNKSYSHAFKLFDVYIEALSNIAEDNEKRTGIVNEVADVWTRSDQHAMILVDRLFRLGIVDSASIIAFVYSDHRRGHIHKALHWRLLSNLTEATVKGTGKASSSLAANMDVVVEQPDLEASMRQEKDIFLMIMQRFVMMCSSIMADSDDGADNLLFKVALARLVQFSRKFMSQVVEHASTLRSLVFTPETEPEILEVFSKVLLIGEARSS